MTRPKGGKRAAPSINHKIKATNDLIKHMERRNGPRKYSDIATILERLRFNGKTNKEQIEELENKVESLRKELKGLYVIGINVSEQKRFQRKRNFLEPTILRQIKELEDRLESIRRK